MIRSTALILAMAFSMALVQGRGQAQDSVTSEPPTQSTGVSMVSEPCPKGKRGGAIGGIVVASVFWIVLPMSIPVWVTQSKKLKSHNAAIRDQRCQYAPKN